MSSEKLPKQILLELLQEKAYRKGIFDLVSGKTSDFYINCKDAVLTAKGHKYVGMEMFYHILEHFPKTQAIAGVALGGCPLASAVSQYSILSPTWGEEDEGTLNALYVRKEEKEYGTKSLIEGMNNVPKGFNVLLLEDVTTSGNSSLKAVKALREAGYIVDSLLVLVDREEGAEELLRDNGVKLQSLFTRKDFIKEE